MASTDWVSTSLAHLFTLELPILPLMNLETRKKADMPMTFPFFFPFFFPV